MTITSRTAIGAAAATAAAAGLALITMTSASAQPAPVGRVATGSAPQVTLVAQLPGNSAIDASPDPSGTTIYFTTNGPGGAGIFRVPAGGGTFQPVLLGGPLRGPAELAVSDDARRLFVADRSADRIFVVPSAGGAARTLRGTAGTAPQGLELLREAGRDYVVYTGRDPRDRRPAVMRIGVGGASRPTILHEGAPLVDPDGVAVSKTGVVYVSDQGGSDGRVLRLDSRGVTSVASGVTLGKPGGIALTLDDSKLLISALNPTTHTAQVVILDTRTGATSTFDQVIDANHMAGGLHRARATAAMGWAGVSGPGRIYRIDP